MISFFSEMIACTHLYNIQRFFSETKGIMNQILWPKIAFLKIDTTRKNNPFHGFLNGLTPVCLQCVPALNISLFSLMTCITIFILVVETFL